MDMFDYLIAGMFGAVLGSFANVCIIRMPHVFIEGKRWSLGGRSRCMSCQHQLAWNDMIPLISFLRLQGRCRYCQNGISKRYWVVEALCSGLWVALCHVILIAPTNPTFLPKLSLGSWTLGAPYSQWFLIGLYGCFAVTLVVIAFIDFDHKLILNRITYPAIPLFYLASLLISERPVFDGLIGILVGYGVVRLISDGYYYMFKREGLGYGDGKLLAIVGGVLDWEAVFYTVFIGSIIGSVVGISVLLLAHRRKYLHNDEDNGLPSVGMQSEIPFGPSLVIGAFLYLFWFI